MNAPVWFLDMVDYRLDLLKSFWHGSAGGITFWVLCTFVVLYGGYLVSVSFKK